MKVTFVTKRELDQLTAEAFRDLVADYMGIPAAY